MQARFSVTVHISYGNKYKEIFTPLFLVYIVLRSLLRSKSVDILVIFMRVQVAPIVQSCCMLATGASPHTNGHHFYLHLQLSLRLRLMF